MVTAGRWCGLQGEAVFSERDGRVERMKLIGSYGKMRIEPLDRQPGISNYCIGNDPAKWRTNIPLRAVSCA